MTIHLPGTSKCSVPAVMEFLQYGGNYFSWSYCTCAAYLTYFVVQFQVIGTVSELGKKGQAFSQG